jgi:hypothetical protein
MFPKQKLFGFNNIEQLLHQPSPQALTSFGCGIQTFFAYMLTLSTSVSMVLSFITSLPLH